MLNHERELVNRCIAMVADETNLLSMEIIGPSRREPVVKARRKAMRLAWSLTELTNEEIGESFNRCRNTVSRVVNNPP